MLFFVASIVAFGCAYWYLKNRQPTNFPPGPRFPLPVVGDAWMLGSDITVGFEKLRDKYGDIVGLWLGPERSIILNTPELINEAMGKEEFADRPPFKTLRESRGTTSDGDTPGVIFLNGHAWSEQRRFALKNLRDLGFGKRGMEVMVEEEVEDLCNRLEALKGNFIQTRQLFNKSALKALWKVLTNEDLSESNSALPALWKRMDAVFERANNPIFQVAIAYPFMSKVFEALNVETFDIVFKDFMKVANGIVKSHEDSFQADSLRDFTDAYLKNRNDNAENPKSSFFGKDGSLNQSAVLNDLLQAGTDTTSITMSWALLYMVENPDIQKKVQDELDRVVGRSRLPCWADRVDTPYTEAVLHEVQRCGDIVPNGVAHMTNADVNFAGYFIPRGTQVVPLLTAVLRSPKLFPNPDKFDPTRYITADGKFEPNPNVIPFGVGKRRCLGETLARMELYRFFTGVVHRFTVEKRKGEVIPTERELGQASMPAKFEVKFVTRN